MSKQYIDQLDTYFFNNSVDELLDEFEEIKDEKIKLRVKNKFGTVLREANELIDTGCRFAEALEAIKVECEDVE